MAEGRLAKKAPGGEGMGGMFPKKARRGAMAGCRIAEKSKSSEAGNG